MLARFLYSRKKDTLKSTYYTRTPIIFYVKLLEQDSYTLKYETNTQLSQYSYPGADKKKTLKMNINVLILQFGRQEKIGIWCQQEAKILSTWM